MHKCKYFFSQIIQLLCKVGTQKQQIQHKNFTKKHTFFFFASTLSFWYKSVQKLSTCALMRASYRRLREIKTIGFTVDLLKVTPEFSLRFKLTEVRKEVTFFYLNNSTVAVHENAG